MDYGRTKPGGFTAKKILIFFQLNVPQLKEDYYKVVNEARTWGHDVEFATSNCKFISLGLNRSYPVNFFSWVDTLKEYIGLVETGYTPPAGELTRLDFRAMNIIRNHGGLNAG